MDAVEEVEQNLRVLERSNVFNLERRIWRLECQLNEAQKEAAHYRKRVFEMEAEQRTKLIDTLKFTEVDTMKRLLYSKDDKIIFFAGDFT